MLMRPCPSNVCKRQDANDIQISPPPDWSMDPEDLDNETEWAPQGSQGHTIGVVYRLGECVPVMCNLNGSEVIFTAGGNFYELLRTRLHHI